MFSELNLQYMVGVCSMTYITTSQPRFGQRPRSPAGFVRFTSFKYEDDVGATSEST